jgi:hypothetical protein
MFVFVKGDSVSISVEILLPSRIDGSAPPVPHAWAASDATRKINRF